MKHARIAIVLALLAGWLLPIKALAAGVSLLMVPREDVPLRVGMDIGNRHPTLLLSYKVLNSGQISLHGWNGSEWVNISEEAFASGTFYPVAPEDAVIVADELAALPPSLLPSSMWCPAVYKITTTKPRPLLHLLGRHYDFKYADWKWFSDNYKMPIKAINPEGLNIAWYHQPFSERIKKSEIGDDDLQYLTVVRSGIMDLPPETPSGDDMSEAPEESPADDVEMQGDNPLTNDAPQAVVLGADDADEATPDAQADTNTSPDKLEPQE